MSAAKSNNKIKKVAVVGGGIAGCGAAWSLRRAGIDATIYEKKPKLGGNAKQYTWDVEGHKVNTGLAVLAWPEEYFHNYNCLIEELKIEWVFHELKYCILTKKSAKTDMDQSELLFTHGQEDKFPDWLKEDLKKWKSLVDFVIRVNSIFSPCEYPSLYRVNFMNPLNAIPLKWFALYVFGISQKFWDLVFVPIHTSTFIEVEMTYIPAFMAEILEGIVPLTRIPAMRTWKTTGFDVMQEMTKGWPENSVRTACAVEKVEFKQRKGNKNDLAYDVIVHDENGGADIYDAVIFACSAPAMNRALHGIGKSAPGVTVSENHFNGLNTGGNGFFSNILGRIERYTLTNTMYTTDRDVIFPKGVVHSEGEKVIPAKFKDYVLNEVCNLMIVPEDQPENLENTFVISSWAPTMDKPELKGKKAMLVTYGGENVDKVDPEWAVTSVEAHPVLTIGSLASSALIWPLFQGSRDGQCYFCASSVTPGNGHDLSLLSGFVAAAELGAPHPFSSNKKAKEDFERLRNLMMRFSKSKL